MDYVLILAGVLIIVIVLHDIVLTVLVPTSGVGLVRRPVDFLMWESCRAIGHVLPRSPRERLLLYMGPLTIGVTLIAWIAVLILGWALIYKPALGSSIVASSGATDTSWASAIYYSGMALTTLGIGDLAPVGATYRLLTIAQSALGFAVFSLVITYILSVYSNLIGWNAFSQGIHHLSGQTGDAVELISRSVLEGDLPGIVERFHSQADMFRQAYQAYRFYPVLRHFHFREPHHAVPRVVLVALETATLIRTALDKNSHRHLVQSVAIKQLLDAALDLAQEFQPRRRSSPPPHEEEEAWRTRYAHALDRLEIAGLKITNRPKAGADDYVQMRSLWESAARHMADELLYTWEEVMPLGMTPAPIQPDR